MVNSRPSREGGVCSRMIHVTLGFFSLFDPGGLLFWVYLGFGSFGGRKTGKTRKNPEMPDYGTYTEPRRQK